MTLDQLSQAVEQTYGVYQARTERVTALQAEVEALKADVALLGLTDAALGALLATVSQENLKQIEGLVTYGLRTVFDDLVLTFRFVQTQTKSGPSLEPMLLQGEVEAPLLDAFGGGPATVVAFLLRLIVAHRLGLYPLLLLDESFAQVSTEYVDNVAKLLKELAAQLGWTFILVTQQRSGSFLEQADCAYTVIEATGGVTFEPLKQEQT